MTDQQIENLIKAAEDVTGYSGDKADGFSETRTEYIQALRDALDDIQVIK